MAVHRVRLAGRDFPLERLRRRPADFTAWFTRARTEHGYAQCLCTRARLRLVIRQRRGRHYLAVWPGEGILHALTSWFHQEEAPADPEAGAPVRGAIEQTSLGTTVRLNLPLESTPAPDHDHVPVQRGETSSPTTRRTTGLLGLLHHLWERAGLVRWDQCETPTWEQCARRLTRAAERTRVNRIPLERGLYVVPPYTAETARTNRAAFERWKEDLRTRSARGLLLSEIKDVTRSRYNMSIRLRHLHAPVYIRPELLERVRRSYRGVLSAPSARARCLALIAVEITDRGNLRAVDTALMLTNGGYLPADSSHEVDMADALTGAGRTFVKPLRPDQDQEFLPDFVLTDTTPPTYVEVYGMLDNDDYRRHQRHKRERYRSQGVPLIEWDVRAPMPDVRAR